MAYTLTLTDEQLAVIDAGLQELKMRVAAPVVLEINRQIVAQRGVEADAPPSPHGGAAV